MIGGEAVPYGDLWRFGANEPTTIHLDVAASIAGLEVEPGSYSLYAVPMEGDEWTLLVNRSTSQWGHESQNKPEEEAQEGGGRVAAGTVADGVEATGELFGLYESMLDAWYEAALDTNERLSADAAEVVRRNRTAAEIAIDGEPS
jgi:hypothetical protein